MFVSATARMRDALTRTGCVDLGFDLSLGQGRKGYSRETIGSFEQALDPSPAKLLAKQRFQRFGLEETAGLGLSGHAVRETQLDLGSSALVAHGGLASDRPSVHDDRQSRLRLKPTAGIGEVEDIIPA